MADRHHKSKSGNLKDPYHLQQRFVSVERDGFVLETISIGDDEGPAGGTSKYISTNLILAGKS